MAEPQRDAGSRLERLLAVLSWLAQHGQVSLTELADQFGMTSEQLTADLELAACCGLPPYTPDRLMEIIVGEDHVEALLGSELGRPRRLSAQEGFALAAAASASVAARGEPTGPDAEKPPLERALAKLEAALGNREVLGVDLGEPAHLATVREAVAAGDQLEIDYVSAWRDARVRSGSSIRCDWPPTGATGISTPGATQPEVRGGSTSTGSSRSEKPVPEVIRRANADSAHGPFVPGEEATLVRLLIPPEAAWLVEAVPVLETSTRKNGSIEVTLGVVSTVWLERLLLQLGPTTEVLEPADLRDSRA